MKYKQQLRSVVMQLLKKKAKPTSRVGLIVNSDLLAIAEVEDRAGSPYLLRCERVALNSEKGHAGAKLYRHQL